MKKLIVILIMGITFNLFAKQNPIGKDAIVKSEFIYEADDVSFPSCHASTIVETSGGLVAAWFGGEY
ncbi:MAG: hypothetical protein ACOC13_00900, partial [Tangfeifania sp.]